MVNRLRIPVGPDLETDISVPAADPLAELFHRERGDANEEDDMARTSKTAERVKDGVDGLVKKTRVAVNGGLDTVNENLKGGVDRIDRRYRETAAQVRGQVARVSNNVNEKVGDARKTLMGRYLLTRKKVSRLQRDSSRYVRDNPGKVLLSIAGLGLLVGLAVSPRRRLARA